MKTISNWNFRALKSKTVALFKQGLTPIELTQSILVAALFSIIPILGVTTILLTGFSLKRKLNLPIMIAISYLAWPLQILMIIPFINIGEFIFSIPQSNHSAQEIIASFQESFFGTLSRLTFELLCGFGGWLLTAVPFFIVIYLVSISIFKLISKDKNKE
jgi:uncharacterized protein (DUF2062 family)